MQKRKDAGFPTGVEIMGGGAFQKLMGGLINTWGVLTAKNTCEGVHLLVKLPAISLEACKFSKNELLYQGWQN